MKGCWQIEPKERPSFAVLEQLLAKNFGELKREEERGRERERGERGRGGRV